MLNFNNLPQINESSNILFSYINYASKNFLFILFCLIILTPIVAWTLYQAKNIVITFLKYIFELAKYLYNLLPCKKQSINLFAIPSTNNRLFNIINYFGNYFRNLKINYFSKEPTIQSKIVSLLSQSPTIILLSSPWGSGKTTFFEKKIKPFSRSIYFSCLTTSNVKELKEFLVIKNNCLLKSLSLLKIYYTYFNSIPALLPKNRIIVIDDFERFSGNYSELLGLLNMLKDTYKNKILILASENNIIISNNTDNKKSYLDFKEKTFDYCFEMDCPTLKECILDYLYLDHNELEKYYLTFITTIGQLFQKNPNIRVLKKIFIYLKELNEQEPRQLNFLLTTAHSISYITLLYIYFQNYDFIDKLLTSNAPTQDIISNFFPHNSTYAKIIRLDDMPKTDLQVLINSFGKYGTLKTLHLSFDWIWLEAHTRYTEIKEPNVLKTYINEFTVKENEHIIKASNLLYALFLIHELEDSDEIYNNVLTKFSGFKPFEIDNAILDVLDNIEIPQKEALYEFLEIFAKRLAEKIIVEHQIESVEQLKQVIDKVGSTSAFNKMENIFFEKPYNEASSNYRDYDLFQLYGKTSLIERIKNNPNLLTYLFTNLFSHLNEGIKPDLKQKVNKAEAQKEMFLKGLGYIKEINNDLVIKLNKEYPDVLKVFDT